MTTTLIKVDTEAIARNGQNKDNPEPAIIVIQINEDGGRCQIKTDRVYLDGPAIIVQDDRNPGALSEDGRLARVWVETEGKIRWL